MATNNNPLTPESAAERIQNEIQSVQEEFEDTLRKCKETVEFLVIGNERQWRELTALKKRVEELKVLSKKVTKNG